MPAYYNEIEPAAAHLLRALIDRNIIAPGEVDTRSIKDVQPDDLMGFTQCHFFAGGGIWSVAARLAGWPDERPLWTGSCPCQPFSVAGKGRGADDPRHLWPDFFRLIRACRPPVVVGEQVAGAAGYGWFDGVSADLEGEGYASRAVDIPACAVDAPHIRQRLYWVSMADADEQGRQGRQLHAERAAERAPGPDGVVDAARVGWREGWPEHGVRSGRPAIASAGSERELADATSGHASAEWQQRSGQYGFQPEDRRDRGIARDDERRSFWHDAELRIGADGKARRVKPGVRLLVDGLPGRVGLVRIGGNAIVAQQAAEVIAALMEAA